MPHQDTMPPWTADETVDIFFMLSDRDRLDEAAAWLDAEITSFRREYAIVNAAAAWAAVLLREVYADVEADGFMLHICEGANPPPDAIGAGQLVIACAEEDEAAIRGHMDALFERPAEFRVRVFAQLTTLLCSLADALRSKHSDTGEQ